MIEMIKEIHNSLSRGEWKVIEKEDDNKNIESLLYMKRYGILLKEVCKHAWWYGTYTLGIRIVYSLIISIPWQDDIPRISLMFILTLLDLVLVVGFTPQIDWLAWISHLFSSMGDFGMCISFLVAAVGSMEPDELDMFYLSFLLIAMIPMICISLCRDGSKCFYAISRIMMKKKTPSNDEETAEDKKEKDKSMDISNHEVVAVAIDSAVQDITVNDVVFDSSVGDA